MFGPEWTDAELLRHFPGSTSDGRTHGPSSGLLAVPNQSHWFSCCHLPPVLTGGSSWRSSNLLLTAAATLAVKSRRRRYPPKERAFQKFRGFAPAGRVHGRSQTSGDRRWPSVHWNVLDDVMDGGRGLRRPLTRSGPAADSRRQWAWRVWGSREMRGQPQGRDLELTYP